MRIFFTLVTLLACTLIFIREIGCVKRCCADGELLLFMWGCTNGANISISCDGRHFLWMNEELSGYDQFKISKDEQGEYLDAYVRGFIVRSPHFCVNIVRSVYSQKTFDEVALVCNSAKIKYHELDTEVTKAPLRDRLYVLILIIFNVSSLVTLVATALLYGILRDLQDSQGVCTFHFSLCMSIFHASLIYELVDAEGLLPDLCITHLYAVMFVLLSSFTWCAILGYNSWISVKNPGSGINENMVLRVYRFVGYGFPASMILFCLVAAHASKLYTEYKLEEDCRAHQTKMLVLSIVLPIIGSCMANCFFYVDMQKRLWNSPHMETRCEKSTMKMMKYRLIMNGKFFFVMGVPWMLLIFFVILNTVFEYPPYVKYCINFLLSLGSIEGVFIFFVLVVRRKKVRKTISRTYGKKYPIIPEQWRTTVDSETDELGGDVDNCRVEFSRLNDNVYTSPGTERV